MYRTLQKLAENIFSKPQIFKHGFNLSPMYKRSTGKITSVSDDLHKVSVKIPLSYKNRNYAGSIFGGSLFAATDPIFMIQLIQILGDNYIVWDKSASIKYKKPAKTDAFADFIFTKDDIDIIKKRVSYENKLDVVKTLHIKDTNGTVLCELEKVIYVADKTYFKQRQIKE